MDISGWFLAGFDTKTTVTDAAIWLQYRFPAGTVIPAASTTDPTQGYLLLNESTTFGANPYFNFSRVRGHIVLANNNGSNPAGYREEVTYAGTDMGTSLGQYWYTISAPGNPVAQKTDLVVMSRPTPGGPNDATISGAKVAPVIGPVVIAEIQYNPPNDPVNPGYEWIELRNTSASDVSLAGWKFTSGVNYTFPAGATIPARGFVVVTETDAATFRARYPAVPAGVSVYGPYSGNLDNGGENVELSKPGDLYGSTVPWVVVDSVDYNNKKPWPTDPDGNGPTLLRAPAQLYGDAPASWIDGPVGGTPGYQEAPVFDLGADQTVSNAYFSRIVSFTDLNSYDGQTWTGSVAWGDGQSEDLNIDQSTRTFTLAHSFTSGNSYNVTVTVTDNFGDSSTDVVVVTVPSGAIIGTDGSDVYTLRVNPNDSTRIQWFKNKPVGPIPDNSLQLAALTDIGVNLGNGDNTLIIDMTWGNPIPAGGLSYVAYAGFDTLQITGTTGADTFTLADTYVLVNSSTISFTGLEQLSLSGGSGNDVCNIGASLSYGLAFSGGAGTGDVLNVTGTAGDDKMTIGGSQVTWGTQTVTFDTIEALNVNLGAGNDTLTVTAALAVGTKTIAGGSGSNKLIVLGDDTDESITASSSSFQWRGLTWLFSQFSQVEFDTYGGNDALTIGSGVGYSITFDGGTGTNFAKFSGSSGDDVYLANGTTTSWGSFLLTPRNCTVQFVGSPGNDTLYVTAPPQYPITFDGGDGTDKLWLYGTSGNDTLLMGPDPNNPANVVAIFNTSTSIGGSIVATNAEAFEMDGYAGNDVIGLTGLMNPLPAIDGGAGTDTLDVTGTSSNDTFAVSGSQATFGTTAIPASSIEQLQIDGGDGNDTVTVSAPLSVPLTFNGGAGDDTLVIPAAPGIMPTFNGGDGSNKWSISGGALSISSDLGGPSTRMSLELTGAATSVTLGASQHLDAITVTDAQLAFASTGSYLMRANSLAINGNGVLDLGGGRLILDSDEAHKAGDCQKLAGYANRGATAAIGPAGA